MAVSLCGVRSGGVRVIQLKRKNKLDRPHARAMTIKVQLDGLFKPGDKNCVQIG
jgi:hypothetical protein